MDKRLRYIDKAWLKATKSSMPLEDKIETTGDELVVNVVKSMYVL